jgi:hypothetical protein
MKDGKALNNYDSNESYTQRDALREAYVDMEQGDWSIRAGKQQVVWGTADGMKLLDAINPTDYTEMAQNQMEDSRMPVWMLNAEKDLTTGGSVQVIVSEAKESKFAGLNASGDQGHAFVMKGVDSITGKVNGFLNIAPALGLVANAFNGMAAAYTNLMADFDASTVQGYSTGVVPGFFEASTRHSDGAGEDGAGAGSSNAYDLWAIANEPIPLGNGGNDEKTNLSDAAVNANWDISNPNSMFEYMGDTTFATFDTFVNMKSEYRRDYPSSSDANIGLKFKDSTASGVNFSLNYLNGYDTNPIIDLHWEDQDTGVRLTAVESTKTTAQGTVVNKVVGGDTAGLQSSVASQTYTTVKVWDGTTYYGKDARVDDAVGTKAPKLVFVEKLNKIQQIGGSLDTAIETATLGPVVLRGEALYQKGVKSPVIDRNKLGIGNVVEALKMVEGDVFKYVLGADITVLTNMMVSAQFIQERNLDFIDEAGTCTGASTGANCGRYTADRSAMHLSNGLQKAEENKEFYSIFLSKPFGASGEHRWNNILMLEENGGKWNRLDAEFSIDDDTQATVEYNKYWGDANTQFGQLEKSSNIQVGVKYSF